MDIVSTGLHDQPFPTNGPPSIFIPSDNHFSALEFLKDTYQHRNGLGLFQGPSLSGKTTLLREFSDRLPENVEVAMIDARGMSAHGFLTAALCQYGYDIDFDSVGEQQAMLRVFAMQQSVGGQSPVLIVENTQAMQPDALATLCEVANMAVGRQSAVRMILAGDRSLGSIVSAPAMECIASRLSGDFHLGPLRKDESIRYVKTKLASCGLENCDKLFPQGTLEVLHERAGGWPGFLDRLALMAIDTAEEAPILAEHVNQPSLPDPTPYAAVEPGPLQVEVRGGLNNDTPKLIITMSGKTVGLIEIDRPRLLLGRIEANDIIINSRFISRHHALIVRHNDATFLIDLNSTNGTFVNSRRITQQALLHEDVIALGNHRIKLIDPASQGRADIDDMRLTETVVMQSIQDVRKMLAAESTQIVPKIDEQAS